MLSRRIYHFFPFLIRKNRRKAVRPSPLSVFPPPSNFRRLVPAKLNGVSRTRPVIEPLLLREEHSLAGNPELP